ncbi:MAG: hypothetical protein NVS3B7_14610 [Candidatus Elarobacter sp.]
MVDLRSWSLYFGLTVPFAIVGHLVFDLTDAGCNWAVLLRPAHLALLALLLGGASAAAYGLGYGLPAAERRRRLGLVRAGLRVDRQPLLATAAGAVVQAMIVMTTLSLDGSALHPTRIALALVAGILAIVFGALAIRIAERHIVDLALARPRRSSARAGTNRSIVRPLRSTRAYALFRPNRAPPLPTAAF